MDKNGKNLDDLQDLNRSSIIFSIRDLVVIGDLMAGGGDVLLEGIDDALGRFLSPFYKKPRIVLADPGDDLVLLGSAAIAIDHVYNHPTELLMPDKERRAHD